MSEKEKEIVITSMTVNIVDSWIPVGTRLPEPEKEVLISCHKNDGSCGSYVTIGRLTAYKGRLEWDTCNGNLMDSVDAWMPKPDAYTGDLKA